MHLEFKKSSREVGKASFYIVSNFWIAIYIPWSTEKIKVKSGNKKGYWCYFVDNTKKEEEFLQKKDNSNIIYKAASFRKF